MLVKNNINIQKMFSKKRQQKFQEEKKIIEIQKILVGVLVEEKKEMPKNNMLVGGER